MGQGVRYGLARALVGGLVVVAGTIAAFAGTIAAFAQECSIEPQVAQETAPWAAAMQSAEGTCDQVSYLLRIEYWTLGAIRQCAEPSMQTDLQNLEAKIASDSQTYTDACMGPAPVFPERPASGGSPQPTPGNTDPNRGSAPGGNRGGSADGGGNGPGGSIPNGGGNGSGGSGPNGGGGNGGSNAGNQPLDPNNANQQPGPAPSPGNSAGVDPQLQQFANTVCAQGDPQSPDCQSQVTQLATQSNFAANQSTFSATSVAPTIQPLSQSQIPDSCGYFTRPLQDEHGINRYADNAFVCFQGEGYSCEDDRWVDKGVCLQRPDDPDADATHLEQSHFNTSVYEDDSGG